MGPFSAAHLQQFVSSNVCQHDQLVCHGPSAVWMPLWLVLQLSGLDCAAAAPSQPTPAQPSVQHKPSSSANQQGSTSQAPARQGSTIHKPHHQASGADRKGASSSSRQLQDVDLDSQDYEYGASVDPAWLKKVRAVEAAAKARQQQQQDVSKQQPQSLNKSKPHQHHQQSGSPTPPQQVSQMAAAHKAEDWLDTEMQDACAEAVLEAVSELRGDQAYLEELHRSIDMEWEPTAAAHSAPHDPLHPGAAQPAAHAAAAPDAGSAVELAALAAGTGANSMPREQDLLLVLVLDTNVALQKPVMQFVRQAQRLQQQGGYLRLTLPSSSGAAGAGACSGAATNSDSRHVGGNHESRPVVGVHLQVVIPWTVLMELDKLKMRHNGVANAARAAVEVMRRELVAPLHKQSDGSRPASVLSVQSLQEFRQAAQAFDFGVPQSSLVADDHILQCALSRLQQLQQPQPQQGSTATGWQRSGVLLMTDDKIMQLKGQANHVPVAGVDDLPPLVLADAATEDATQPLQQQQLPGCLIHMLWAAGITPPWLQPPRKGVSSNASFLPTSAPQLPRSSNKSSSPPRRAAQQEQARQQQLAELSHSASSFLTFLRLQLSQQVVGWFQADYEELWQDVLINKPPWEDLQFVEVLWHHFNGTIKEHLPAPEKRKAGHLKQVLEYLRSMAKRLHQKRFNGVDMHKLPSNLGVRVMEVLTAFGHQEAARLVEAALTAHAAASAPAAADSQTGSTCPPTTIAGAAPVLAVPSMQDAIAAAAAAASAGAEGSAGEMQEQQQGQQDSASPAVVALAAAAAAAAVPAPQPAGPCLTLSQLLMYSLSLLQAVLPVLAQHMAQAAPASSSTAAAHASSTHGQPHSPASLSAGLAVEQQLRAVVQQMELLGQQVPQQQHQQHWLQAMQAEILQMGLLLVQLCSLLLNDEAAGAAVAQQLAQHAHDFVAEAGVYLLQGSHGQQPHGGFLPEQPPGPAVLLQQLSSALHHLQHHLQQAMQQA